jgi:hypothetical protein
MHQAMNGYAFALQVAEILRIGGNFDSHELVDPDVVMPAPDLAECAGPDLAIQNIFPDALSNLCHNAMPFAIKRRASPPANSYDRRLTPTTAD